MPNFAAFAKPTFVFASIVSASTSREMSFTGNGCRRIALTTVKIVVFAPIPSASDNIATALNPGLFSNTRAPCFTSCQNVSISPSQLESRAYASSIATLRLWRQILVPQLRNLQVAFPRTCLLLAFLLLAQVPEWPQMESFQHFVLTPLPQHFCRALRRPWGRKPFRAVRDPKRGHGHQCRVLGQHFRLHRIQRVRRRVVRVFVLRRVLV